jgi:hypothetical protein
MTLKQPLTSAPTSSGFSCARVSRFNRNRRFVRAVVAVFSR